MSAQSGIDETSRQGSAEAWTFSFWGVSVDWTLLWFVHTVQQITRIVSKWKPHYGFRAKPNSDNEKVEASLRLTAN